MEEGEMPPPQLPIVAEGETARGERWYLRAGGSPEAYDSMMETVYADGRRDQGGMGGPALYPGDLLNVYIGRADQGPLRVVARTDPRVQRLRLQSESGEGCDMFAPSAHDTAAGVNLFAMLLPWTTNVTSIQGIDADGQALTSRVPRNPPRRPA
jgi:hypothetical protein